MEKVKRGWENFNKALHYASGFLVLTMMLTVSLQVVMRYFLKSPVIWVDDVNTYSIVFIIFLNAGWLLMKDKHIKMEAFTMMMPPTYRRQIRLLASILALIYTAILTGLTWELAWSAFRENHKFVGGITIPKFPILVIIPIGTFSLSVQYLINIVQHLLADNNR